MRAPTRTRRSSSSASSQALRPRSRDTFAGRAGRRRHLRDAEGPSRAQAPRASSASRSFAERRRSRAPSSSEDDLHRRHAREDDDHRDDHRSARVRGRNPTGIVGGRVAAWGGNLSAGGDELFVVEADEYDRSFLALSPTVATITNVEADHLDIYADLDDIRGAFAQSASKARAVVLCADDTGASSIACPRAP